MFMHCCSSPLLFLLPALLCTFFSSKFSHTEVPYAVFENFFMKEACDSSVLLPSSLGVQRELGMRQEAPKVRLTEIKHLLQIWLTHVSCAGWNTLLPLIAVGFEYNQHLAQQRLKYNKKLQNFLDIYYIAIINVPRNQANQEIWKFIV